MAIPRYAACIATMSEFNTAFFDCSRSGEPKHRFFPRMPRAIYHSDDVTVGYVRGGDVLGDRIGGGIGQCHAPGDERGQESGISGCHRSVESRRRHSQRVALRQCKYLNNVIEQDHRTVKKRVWLAKGYGTFQTAWRTLQGIETVHMIRKGRVRWLAKRDAVGQALFIAWLFGLAD